MNKEPRDKGQFPVACTYHLGGTRILSAFSDDYIQDCGPQPMKSNSEQDLSGSRFKPKKSYEFWVHFLSRFTVDPSCRHLPSRWTQEFRVPFLMIVWTPAMHVQIQDLLRILSAYLSKFHVDSTSSVAGSRCLGTWQAISNARFTRNHSFCLLLHRPFFLCGRGPRNLECLF